MSGRIDTVIFDLGNVLIGWDPRRLYRQLIKDEARLEWFLRDVCNSEWNEQQDAGLAMKGAEGFGLRRLRLVNHGLASSSMAFFGHPASASFKTASIVQNPLPA